MSDVSKTSELIAEARSRANLCSRDAREAMRDTGDIVTRLADALESATRVPVQGEPGDDWIILTEALNSIHLSDWDDVQALCVKSLADAVVDAGFSRATVPDAATEGDYHEGLEEGIKIGRAERDAALAAIEQVRVIHRETGAGGDCAVCNEWGWPCPTIAALDGAPEPEGKP